MGKHGYISPNPYDMLEYPLPFVFTVMPSHYPGIETESMIVL